VIVLKCDLKHSIPRDVHHTPPPPFTQHFRVNLEAKTVDGVRATVSDDKIGWEPSQPYLRPYATLSRPDWQFHEVKYYGHMRDEITGRCVPQG
jgi:predicted RNA-binding protein with PUA-like domain